MRHTNAPTGPLLLKDPLLQAGAAACDVGWDCCALHIILLYFVYPLCSNLLLFMRRTDSSLILHLAPQFQTNMDE